jgi:ABC-2 type transport system permease protein
MDGLRKTWVLAANNLRSRYRSIIIWGVALGAMGALYVALYPVMSQFLSDYLNEMPENMRGFMGDLEGSITIQQWLEMEFLNVMLPIALPIMVIIMGARTIAGNEERKILDLQLSNPLRRSQIIGSAIVTMALSLAAVLAITWVITYLAVPLAGVDLGPGALVQAFVCYWAFCMLFGTMALLISALVRRNAFAVSIPLVVIVATYVLNSLYQASESLDNLKYFSILYYLGHPLTDFPWLATVSILGVTCVLWGLSVAAFAKRDIYT